MNKDRGNSEKDVKVVKKLEEKTMASPFHATVSSDSTVEPSNNTNSGDSDSNNSTSEESGKVDE